METIDETITWDRQSGASPECRMETIGGWTEE